MVIFASHWIWLFRMKALGVDLPYRLHKIRVLRFPLVQLWYNMDKTNTEMRGKGWSSSPQNCWMISFLVWSYAKLLDLNMSD